MPHLTELRCRACKVMGGTTVETDEEAEELSALPRLKVKGQVVRAGEFIELPHCLKDDDELAKYPARFGRPCPRVELEPENGEAMTLLSMSIREDIRHFAQPYFDAAHGNAPVDTRRRLLVRVTRTLTDRAVTDALYPQKGGA